MSCQQNEPDHNGQGGDHLKKAGKEAVILTGGSFGEGESRYAEDQGCYDTLHRIFSTLSLGLTISNRRTPNFSFTTTASPRATSFELTKISSGSPASLVNSTTAPWLSWRISLTRSFVLPNSTVTCRGISRMKSRFFLSCSVSFTSGLSLTCAPFAGNLAYLNCLVAVANARNAVIFRYSLHLDQ